MSAVSPAIDALTVLRVADGRRAAKMVSPSPDGGVEVGDFDAGAVFILETIPVSGIGDLAEALTKLADDPTRLVIRGALAPDRRVRKGGTVYRRKVKGAWQGFLVDQPRHWLLVDVDSVPLPSGLTQADTSEDVVEHVLKVMGEPWRSASVVWKASSKAGLPGVDVVRLHLWFWLDVAVDSCQARGILNALNDRIGIMLADPALADAIQIHYTATPLFAGMPDPVARRLGLRQGAVDAVPTALVLPASPTPTARPRKPAAKAAPTRRPREPERGVPSDGGATRQVPIRSSHYASVLGDVRRLVALRYGGGPLPDGQRDVLFFAAAVAAANADPAGFEVAVARLAAEWLPDKDDTWVDAKLVSLRDGVRRHLDGERVVHNGRLVSPIYGPAVAWLIGFLAVTHEEMETLKVLVSGAVRKRRTRNRTPRREWQAALADEADWNSVCAVELVEARGLPVSVAARRMEMSPRRVRQIIAAHDWHRDYGAPRRCR